MSSLLSGALAVVAVDGPAGAGKTSVCQEVAEALGWQFVNTGAMYRAVALIAEERGVADEAGWAAIMDGCEFRFRGRRVLANGRDVSDELRSPHVSRAVKAVADSRQVREAAWRKQRAMAEAGGVVMEGRDVGTRVVPQARYKFYLDAALEVRARRHLEALAKSGIEADYESVLADLERRDAADRERKVAPLERAPDAFYLDTTWLSRDEVVAFITGLVQSGCKGCKDKG